MKTSKIRKPVVPLVVWTDLSEDARKRLDSSGHPNSRPTERDKASKRPIFRADGSSWVDYGCLAGVF